MGRWRAIIPLMLAFAISAIVGFSIYYWLRSQRAPIVREFSKQVLQTEPVVVAAKDLILGQKIQPDMITTADYLKKSLPPDSFSDTGLVTGRVVIAPIKQNEPIAGHRLAPEDVTIGGVSALVATGKRAIAVKGDKVIGLSGFIRPGNRVDVLVTIQDPNRTKDKDITKIVLEDIPVLASGTLIQENDKGESAPVDVYTLEVTPEEGEKLALASTKGRLQFALRNEKDTETVTTVGATIPQLLTSYRPLPPPPEPVVKGPKRSVRRRTMVMEIIKDGRVVRRRFRQ